nr:phage Gp37/Gp68 family protein [uncultured Rhodopila sp.]
MAENSAIEWTDHTFNPWVGCTAVSQGCDNCYARVRNQRLGHDFAVLRRTAAANWRKPLKWNRDAAVAGVRRRVFCASWADVFDNQAPETWRADLWDLISMTRSLDWLLLTKRPQNIAKMLPKHPAYQPWPWPHVWLGTTAENQEEADRRIPHLLAAPAAVRFLSVEPMLGAIDLNAIDINGDAEMDCLRPESWQEIWDSSWSPEATGLPLEQCINDFVDEGGTYPPTDAKPPGIDWVICGGESGPDARPMHPDWEKSIRLQCEAAGVPYFRKQWGEWAPICAMSEAQVDGCYYPAPEDFPESRRREKVESIVLHADGTEFHGGDRFGGQAFAAGSGAMTMFRLGKARAGHLLDGREHRALPGMTGGQTGAIGGQTT